jgi:hypothetical protein
MKVKANKNKITFLTLASAVLFTLVTVVASLISYGPHTNKFGSGAMWLSVLSIFIVYLFPLTLFIIGLDKIKYFIAVIIGAFSIGLLISGIIFIGLIGNAAMNIVMAELALCLINLIVNILWYYTVFGKDKVQRASMYDIQQ